MKKERTFLCIILLAGAFLRIYDLGTESLWIDEVTSIMWAKQSPSHIVERAALDVHPPFYFVLLHYWINLFGDSEYSARVLSAIIGIISLYMIFKVGSLIFGSEAGLLSALIMAASVFHIWYSQEARPYSLLVLLSLLSLFFFIRLHRRRTHRDSVGYILSSSLLIYTHYFGFFIIIAQNIFSCTLLFLGKEHSALDIKRWFALQGLLIISYIPWIGTVTNQISKIGSGEMTNINWIPMPSFYTLVDSLREYSGSWGLMVLFLAFAFLWIVSRKKTHPESEARLSELKSMYLLALWLAVTLILPMVISHIFKPVYVTRYAIAASLALYIMAAGGIAFYTYKPVKYTVVSCILALSLMNVYHYYDRIDKQQWREVIRYVDENSKTGDKIIFIPGGPVKLQVWDYYSHRRDVIKEPFVLQGNDEDNMNNLKSAVAGRGRIWFIVSGGKDFKDIFQEVLRQSSYNLWLSKKFDGMHSLPK